MRRQIPFIVGLHKGPDSNATTITIDGAGDVEEQKAYIVTAAAGPRHKPDKNDGAIAALPSDDAGCSKSDGATAPHAFDGSDATPLDRPGG